MFSFVFLEAALFGIFGLIIGSFLNVLIYRQGTGKGLGGRSRCMSCGKTLEWFDLIPVFSWIALRAKCRFCGSRVSIQYPLVEASTGIIFAFIGAAPTFGISYKLLSCAIAALLIAIAAYDIKHTIIPDPWVWTFNILAFLVSLIAGSWQLAALLAGPLAALPLAALWYVSKGRWMGFGDAKLALGIGWLLGPFVGLASVMFAFVIGAAVSVCILIPLSYKDRIFRYLGITRLSRAGGGLTMKSEVAFGPFLILSCIMFWLLALYGMPLPFGSFGM